MFSDTSIYRPALMYTATCLLHDAPLRSLKCCKQNQDSSENTTSFHSCVKIRSWTHHWRHFCLKCSTKDSGNHDRWADSPCYCKCRRTFLVDTCLTNNSISRFKACEMTAQFITVMLVKCLSFWHLMIQGQSSTTFRIIFLNTSMSYSDNSI